MKGETLIKAKVTHKGFTREGDTISVFDGDGREIAIRRVQISPLRKLLKDISKKDAGSLKYLEYCGYVW